MEEKRGGEGEAEKVGVFIIIFFHVFGQPWKNAAFNDDDVAIFSRYFAFGSTRWIRFFFNGITAVVRVQVGLVPTVDDDNNRANPSIFPNFFPPKSQIFQLYASVGGN